MNKISLLYALAALLLAGCHDIPDVADPHHITVEGHPITAEAFLRQYCQGKIIHPTCVAVSQASVQDATRGKMPAGW